jgi:putative chitinase
MREFGITTPQRQAAFLAQVCHESGSLRYTREIASGAEYDVGAKAVALGNTPVDDGDGERYKGRGLLQITGRTNYARCAAALNMDLIDNPALLEAPAAAARASAWWWREHGCNELADQNLFGTLCKRINGGYNGLDDRIKHWVRIRKVLGL